MRWLVFYARSRRVPTALLASAGAVVLMWLGWIWFSDSREISSTLTVLTVLLALAPLIPTMAGDDDSLESSAAILWPPRRALHLLAFAALACVPLLASAATGAWFGPSGVILRNAAGFAGLIGLGVAVAGIRMAWQLPLCWTVVQLMFGTSEPGWREAVYWLLQPAGSRPAAAAAIALLAAGVLAYAWRVGPRPAPAEAALGQ